MGKLALVLDLDHTLLNSARWGEVSPKDSIKLEEMMAREEKLPENLKNLFSIEVMQMWTKLRPHCREFLRALSRKFVMWIHTNGNRSVVFYLYFSSCSHLFHQALHMKHLTKILLSCLYCLTEIILSNKDIVILLILS